MRLSNKFLAILLPLTLVPFVLISLTGYFLIADSYADTQRNRLRGDVKQTRDLIANQITANLEKLDLLADVPDIKSHRTANSTRRDSDIERIRGLIAAFKTRESHVLELIVLGPKGKRITEITPQKSDSIDQAVLDEFVNSSIISEVSQSAVFKTKKGLYAVLYGRKINSVTNTNEGYIVAAFDVRQLYPALSPVTEVGSTALMFDGRSTEFLSAFNGDLTRDQIAGVEWQESLTSTSALAPMSFVQDQKRYEIVSVPIWNYSQNYRFRLRKEQRWFLGIVKPVEGLPGLRGFQIAFSVLFLGATLVVVTVAYLVSRRISVPIEQVSNATALISKGKPYPLIPDHGNDEVSDLARAVTRMKGDLDSYQEQLVRNARLSAMGEMTSEISHEIQNRISGISLWLQHLDSEVEPEHEFQEYIDEMKVGLNGFVDMLAGLKQYYKEPQLEKSQIDIGALLAEIKGAVSERATEAGVNVTLNVETTEEISGDRERLYGVFLNLLLNAVEEAGDDGNVVVRSEITGEKLIVTFEDSGPGVPVQDRERVFYPFFTTKASGSGLGLSISRNIVFAHGGAIHLGDSELGGAQFEIELPVNTDG